MCVDWGWREEARERREMSSVSSGRIRGGRIRGARRNRSGREMRRTRERMIGDVVVGDDDAVVDILFDGLLL